MAPPCHQHADDTSIHTATQAAAVAVSEGVLPFCRASNSLLSVAKCIGMLLGPEAANSPVGHEPHSGMHFVQPGGEPVRHLGILLSATDQEAATQTMFAKRLVVVRLRVRAWSKFDLPELPGQGTRGAAGAGNQFVISRQLPAALRCLAGGDSFLFRSVCGHWVLAGGPCGPTCPHA